MKRYLVLVGLLFVVLMVIPVGANPPGVPSTVGKKVFQFNLIGTPKDYAGGCGNGARIFVNRGTSSAKITVNFTSSGGWDILDCNGTGSHIATLQNPDLGTFVVYARILGKVGGHLSICADVLVDPATQEALCVLGTFSLTRSTGKSSFQLVPKDIFATALYNVLWTVTTNADYRLAQFRVYEIA